MPIEESPSPPVAFTGGGAIAESLSLSFPGVTDERVGAIPPLRRRQRPSPAYDPLLRARLSSGAKWLMVVGALLFVAWFPTNLYRNPLTEATDLVWLDPSLYSLAVVMVAAILATVAATGIPRILLPGIFGRWHEAVEAARDWIVVGVITGALYWLTVVAARDIRFGPATGVSTPGQWMLYRMPLLAVAGILGLLCSRSLTIRRDGVLDHRVGIAALQMLLQVALLTILQRACELLLFRLSPTGMVAPLLGAGALACAFLATSLTLWAFAVDASLTGIRRRRGATGINDGAGPVNLTLTVIGGRESGKTVLLAAAFYEWSTQHVGNIRITPSQTTGTGISAVENLEDIARELYVDNQFPIGTVSTQNLPFELSVGQEKIARFSFLDYPGGAIAGRVADQSAIQAFWERVDDTDGVVLIADMSYVRRARKDGDWLEVRNAYRTVMQRLVDRNGKRRVVPVALVLTKCDEFVDPQTGHIDTAALKAGLKEFQYDDLEEEWRHLNAECGPGIVEFTTWITSAITYSEPQTDAEGRPDLSKPYKIAPPPPTITPTGCASPLLWLTSKAMRWNVTLFYDITRFLTGSTPAVRRRVNAVLELERIAMERSGQA